MRNYLPKLVAKFQPFIVIVGFAVSLFVSIFFLTTLFTIVFGILLLVGIRLWWLNRRHARQTQDTIMEGEYRVIEDRQVITITKKPPEN